MSDQPQSLLAAAQYFADPVICNALATESRNRAELAKSAPRKSRKLAPMTRMIGTNESGGTRIVWIDGSVSDFFNKLGKREIDEMIRARRQQIAP